MRGVVQSFVRHCLSLSFWQVFQFVFFISYFSAQYALHIQLSTRLDDALARLDKLEHFIKDKGNTEAQMKPYGMKQNAAHSRGKRHAKQDRLDELWERIESLENRISASASNLTMVSDREAFCVQGPQGTNGTPGKNGIPGRDGLPGRDGRDGTDGRDGIPGINGIPGRQGLPGRDGATGPKGEKGHKGHKGKPGPKGPPGDPVMCHKELPTTVPKEDTSGSTVFIRWGSRVCPADRGTVLVYEGRVAGWRPKQQGGGANYLCMPLTPMYSKPPTPGDYSKASLYGVKYGEVEDLFAIPGRGKQIRYLGVPCAMCRVEKRGSLMMIPARNVCPSRQWTREYHGYLMTDVSNSSRTEYICVDADATGVNVTNRKSHSGTTLLTSVQGKCGVLPCPRYRQDWELTCAVCTM